MTHKEIQAAIAALNLPASVHTGSRIKKRKTFRADYTTANGPEVLIAKVRWDDECGNGHNTFAVTATIYGKDVYPGQETVTHKGGRVLYSYAGGCCHEEIAKWLPELAHLIRWHLFDPVGPLHYVANTVYHASERDCWGLLKGEFRQHTSRGPHQAGGVEGVPCWELRMPNNQATEVYTANKPGPVTLEWQPYGMTGEGKARQLDSARATAVWPDASDDDLTAPGLEARLIARLPALVAEMKRDVEALGFTF